MKESNDRKPELLKATAEVSIIKQPTIENTENILGTGSIGRLIIQFAVPGVLAMLVNALYNIVDQIFIGRGVGYLGNGAANVVLLMTIVTLALSLLIGDGAAAYYSLCLGAGKKEDAARGAGNALLSITGLSLVTMAAGLLFLKQLLWLFGATKVLMPLAEEYGRIVVMGLPFIMISTAINAMIRADGSPKYAMAAMIAGAVVNGCLDPVFIFGFRWGIAGAAWSTFIGQLVTFLISAAYIRRFRCIVWDSNAFRPSLSVMKQTAALGISSFIDQVAFTLVMVVNNHLITHYGAFTPYGSEIPLTAYGIAMKVQEILFTVLLGIGIGMQPIVGYNKGAGNDRRVRKAYEMALVIGTVVSVGATAVFIFLPEPLIGLFGANHNELYLEFSKQFFRTYFLCYIFFGFQTITGIFFQAIGKPMQAAAISLSYHLLFKIVSALILTRAMGLGGVLWSGPAADLMTFVICAVLAYREMRCAGRYAD